MSRKDISMFNFLYTHSTLTLFPNFFEFGVSGYHNFSGFRVRLQNNRRRQQDALWQQGKRFAMFRLYNRKMPSVSGEDFLDGQSFGNSYHRCIHEPEVEFMIFLKQFDTPCQIPICTLFDSEFPVD